MDMDIPQLKLEIQKLPQEAATKPLLAAVAEHLEGFSNSLTEIRRAPRVAQIPPLHPYGPCNSPECQACAQAAQEAVLFGRQSFMGELDHAFAWANRGDIAGVVTEIYSEWLKAGKPEPAKA